MSKKTPEKKSRRRLKRSVRRSFAAVLMITAIGVAAIPVPENEAAGSGSSTQPIYTTDYSYDISGFADLTTDQKKSPGAETYSSRIIKQLSDGSWQMDWQFEFYLKTIEGSQKGIVSKYNSTYQSETVVLDTNVVYEYATVTEDEFNTFYNDHGADEKICTKPDLGDVEFMQEFFPTAYSEYVTQYADYQNAHKAWVEAGSDPALEPHAPVLKKLVSQLSDIQKQKYYCDTKTFGSSLRYKGCSLEKVIDSKSSGVTLVYVYIPKRIDGAESTQEFDANGFMVDSKSPIIGIGNEAFKDTKNVHYLTLPSEIKFIGKEAFKDSFIKSISFDNVQEIGDRAFMGCSQLTSVSMGDGTCVIGNEAFRGAGLTSVVFPYSVNQIGAGAFAFCESIQNVDFGAVAECVINDYAFYNDIGLNGVNFIKNGTTTSVKITTIGTAAFAVSSGPTGSMSTFAFPDAIAKVKGSGTEGLGDLVLAGRSNLKNVIMPKDFGRSTAVTLPENIFYNCINLSSVEFPDDGIGSCGLVNYKVGSGGETNTFKTIRNKDLYVKGPARDRSGDIASPRKATWVAKTAVSDVIPYVYVEGGVEYYEVSDGNYLLCVDVNGVLISCTKAEGATLPTPLVLTIPSKVGERKVTGIATNCFNDTTITQAVTEIIIEDDSITSIDDSTFENTKSSPTDKGKWCKLKKVTIGNSVQSIGTRAFADCENLTEVVFNTPKAGHDAFTLGTDAFKTNGTELTFYGDIVEGYDPFEKAVDPTESLIDSSNGTRICYKSLSPTFYTVMYGEIETEKEDGSKVKNGYVTLLDYPKYDNLDDIEVVVNGRTVNHNAYMEQYYYTQYGNSRYDAKREAFITQYNSDTSSNHEDTYKGENYGPWINDYFCNYYKNNFDPANPQYPGDVPEIALAPSVQMTNEWSLAKLLFEPLEVQAAGGTGETITPYFSYAGNAYSMLNNYEHPGDVDYLANTMEEETWIQNARNINVPKGITSIDVKGYIKNNARNAALYLRGSSTADLKEYEMYSGAGNTCEASDPSEVKPGLFSGYYKDGNEGSGNTAKFERGNDYIQSVTLNSVKYLPDYAFDSCENLQSVILGDECADIGTAPFRGCTALKLVSDNTYYTTQNGIVYSKNSDGSLTIEECLASRGIPGGVGGSTVSPSFDENIPLVTTIKDGAFEECDGISWVNLDSATGLLEIPKNCFKNCSMLNTVDLSRGVNNIKEGAFEGDSPITVTIPSTEVFISRKAFSNNASPDPGVTLYSYDDSAAQRYADTYGYTFALLGTLWKVTFLNMDGEQIGETQYVEDGYTLKKAQIPADPTLTGYTFDKWVGTDAANVKINVDDAITSNTVFVAQYTSDGGMVDGKYVIQFFDSVDGTQIGATQYVLPGESAVAPQAPEHKGYTFQKWSDTVLTNIQSNKTILAIYTQDGTTSGSTTSGGSSNTSGSSTGGNTSKDSTSSGATTSNTSNSTTSSTNSTSTTSSTSNTMYTVMVVNGSGSGSYAAGTTVVVAANTPAPGMAFSKWTTESNGVAFASVSLPATTFVMPANNVTVTANYVAGSGSGNAATPTATGGSTNRGNTIVDITKPGISNKDLATANVNGATDNFVIRISETDEATQAVAAALTNKYGSLENILYYAMDISLYDETGTTRITNTDNLSVDITVPIPDALIAYGGNNMAGAVINGNQLEDLSERFTTINGVPCISFTATHFSPYTIYVDTQNLTEGALDITPKTGDPIHPKWFLAIGLACLSIILFIKKDKGAVKAKVA